MGILDDITAGGAQVQGAAQGALDQAGAAASTVASEVDAAAAEVRSRLDQGLATVREGAADVQAKIAEGRATIDDAVGRGRALLGQAQTIVGEILAIPTMARAVIKDTMGLIEDVVDTLIIEPIAWLNREARDAWVERITTEWRRGWDGWAELLAVYDVAAARGNDAATIPFRDRIPPTALVMDIAPAIKLFGAARAAETYVWPPLQGKKHAIPAWYFTPPAIASRDIPCPRVVPRPGEVWSPLWAMRNAAVVPAAGYAAGSSDTLMRWIDYTALAAVARRVDPMRLAWPSTGWGEIRGYDWLAQPALREYVAQPLTEDGTAPDTSRPGLTRADYAKLAAMASVNLATGALIYESPLELASRRTPNVGNLVRAALAASMSTGAYQSVIKVGSQVRMVDVDPKTGRYTGFVRLARPATLPPPASPALEALAASPAGVKAAALAGQVARGMSTSSPVVVQALADPAIGPLLRRALGL